MSEENTDGQKNSIDEQRRNFFAILGAAGATALAGCIPESRATPPVGKLNSALSVTNVQVCETIGSVTVVGDLRTASTVVPPSSGTALVIALGFWSAGDGAGGLFEWDASATGDDGGTIISPTGWGSTGRWRRLYDSELNAKWFGATSTSDLGAALNAADAALASSAAGTIWVPPGNYTISTQIVLSHSLRLGTGLYSTNTEQGNPAATFLLKDNVSISGEGWGTVIQEPDGYQVFACFNDVANGSNDGNSNLRISDLQVVGRSSHSFGDNNEGTIGLGNSKNCQVKNIFFNGTKCLAVQIGASHAQGFFADGVWITDCLLDRVEALNITVVNAQNWHVDNNICRQPGGGVVGAAGLIDVEPNTAEDVMTTFTVNNNVVDGRGCIECGGIGLQGTQTGPGVVSGNSFIGEQTLTFVQWVGGRRG